jgi:hypothetical protein
MDGRLDVSKGASSRTATPKCRSRAKARREGGSNSVVESQPSKLLVAGSIPVSRSIRRSRGSRASFGRQATEGRTKGTVGKRLRLREENGRLVGRSRESTKVRAAKADVAQLAERVLGKDEVTSSILVIGSISARDFGWRWPVQAREASDAGRKIGRYGWQSSKQHQANER